MSKVIIALFLVFFIPLLFTTCDNVSTTPAPEVEVIDFTPVGAYSYPGDTLAVSIDTLYFKVWNYVDCRIKDMTYVYRSVQNGSSVTPVYEMGLDVYLSGGDQSCEGSNITKLINIWLETDAALDYMYANNDNTVAEITFSGEDDYGKGKTFTCNKIHFSLNKIPSSSQKKGVLSIRTGGK